MTLLSALGVFNYGLVLIYGLILSVAIAGGCRTARHRFTSQRRGIDHRFTLYHHAIQRNPLSRLYHDDIIHFHIVRIDLL